MVDVLNLYADDSGSRKSDRKEDHHPVRNWFGLGGILIRERDEPAERERYDRFVAAWPELKGVPLHSVAIRNRSHSFSWLRKDAARESAFGDELTALICKSSILCVAVVIDRPGYRARYEAKYEPRDRWLLCKTAFTILVERAVKHAQAGQQRLRVHVERSDEKTDKRTLGYYEELKAQGMPFSPPSMATYQPLDAAAFAATVYEFRTKNKSSPMMQLADLCLYPVCRAAYDEAYRPYRALVDHGRLIDAHVRPEERATRGIKYSCFSKG